MLVDFTSLWPRGFSINFFSVYNIELDVIFNALTVIQWALFYLKCIKIWIAPLKPYTRMSHGIRLKNMVLSVKLKTLSTDCPLILNTWSTPSIFSQIDRAYTCLTNSGHVSRMHVNQCQCIGDWSYDEQRGVYTTRIQTRKMLKVTYIILHRFTFFAYLVPD